MKNDSLRYQKNSEIADRLLELSVNKGKPLNSDDLSVLELLNDNEKINLLKEELINDAPYISEFLIDASDEKIDNETKKLIAKLRRRKPKHKLNISIYVASGVAVAIMFFSFLAYKNKHQKDAHFPQYLSVESVELNITKPTLILASGETVTVTEESNKSDVHDKIDGVIEDNSISYLNASEKTAQQIDSLVYNKLIIPSQSTYKVVLNDGTEVILNANTTLEYPVAFNGDTREVKFSGEAYFKVAKSDKPFIVVMGDERVQVYGTEFNIKKNKSYGTEVVLVSGSVGYKNSKTKEVVMKPSQMVTKLIGDDKIGVSHVNPMNHIAWQNNLFKFKDKDIYSIITDIAQWYGVEFEIKSRLHNSTYTLIMSRNTSLYDAIKHLSKASGLVIINKGEGVYTIE